jgi:mono/diheme cytochrome c family protein
MRAPIVWLFLGLAAPAWAAPIEIWSRTAKGPTTRVQLDPAKLEAKPMQLKDHQYGGAARWYKAAPLEALLKQSPPGPLIELALLRFENGMVIPVHFRDAEELRKLKAFVAVATADAAPDKGGTWSTDFAPAPRLNAEGGDAHPLKFAGHKLVVESAWHPMVAAGASKTFNPWAFADTLVGIEYVDEVAWYGQFEPDDAAAKAGAAVFRGRCQFCHGVKQIGASYGWDFVEPYPMFKHRNPSSLAMHLKHREQDAPRKGLMMPAFPEITKADTEAAWKWLEAMGTAGLKPYSTR